MTDDNTSSVIEEVIPPKSIWDPQESQTAVAGAGEGEEDEMGDDDEQHLQLHHQILLGSPPRTPRTPPRTPGRGDDTISHLTDGGDTWTVNTNNSPQRRRRHKHPSQMNEVELRVQLWDSYRLARIILGVPIKTFRLQGRVILKAIRAVAEMKLELIRLTKELEMAQIVVDVPSTTTPAETGEVNKNPSSPNASSYDEKKESSPTKLPPTVHEQLAAQRLQYKRLRDSHDRLVKSMEEQLSSIQHQLQSTPQESDSQLRETLGKEVACLQESVREATRQTSAQLASMQKKLDAAYHQRPSVAASVGEESQKFEKKLNTAKVLHRLELESAKAKHSQQVSDMNGQLECFKLQVKNQERDLKEWRRKYRDLERMAVTPNQAKDVLEAWQNLNLDDSSCTPQEQRQAQQDIVQVLQRMTQLHARQETERNELHRSLEAAEKLEKKSSEELSFMELQRDLLKEDIGAGPDEWRQQLSQQRKTYQKQIAKIFKKEEERLNKIDELEIELREMAFTAVEVEDLQAEFQTNQASHTHLVEDVEKRSRSTRERLEALQAELKQIRAEQNQTLHDLAHKQLAMDKAKALAAMIEKEDNPYLPHGQDGKISGSTATEDLIRRKEELEQAKIALQQSLSRVEATERNLSRAQAIKNSFQNSVVKSDDTSSTARLSEDELKYVLD